MRPLVVLVFFFVLAVLPAMVLADLSTSTNFRAPRQIIDVGGGRATSTNFQAEQSTGQPGTGISTSTNFILKGGFLYFDNPAAPAAPTPTPQPSPSGGGGSELVKALARLALQRRPPPLPEDVARCDFNADNRCNLIDLSIMLFYYERLGPEIARYDLNISGSVDFPDVSVLMFYWTG